MDNILFLKESSIAKVGFPIKTFIQYVMKPCPLVQQQVLIK